MERELQIGTYVHPKPGGPVMLIQAFDGQGCCYCIWMEDGQRKVGRYAPDDLEIVDPEEEQRREEDASESV